MRCDATRPSLCERSPAAATLRPASATLRPGDRTASASPLRPHRVAALVSLAIAVVTYRAEELAQSGRMLTIFALYVRYTGDAAFMLSHFAKARALARWLLYRYELSLGWKEGDPRRGIVAGGDEGDGFVAHYEKYDLAGMFEYKCARAARIETRTASDRDTASRSSDLSGPP